jgi:aconitase B
MRLSLIWAAPLLMIAAAPAYAQDTTEAPTVKKPRKICRTEQVTGRRIGDSVCHTADEWATIDAVNKENARKFINNTLAASGRQTGTFAGDGPSVMGTAPH